MVDKPESRPANTPPALSIDVLEGHCGQFCGLRPTLLRVDDEGRLGLRGNMVWRERNLFDDRDFARDVVVIGEQVHRATRHDSEQLLVQAELPEWLSWRQSPTGRFIDLIAKPGPIAVGEYLLHFTATDRSGASTSYATVIEVEEVAVPGIAQDDFGEEYVVEELLADGWSSYLRNRGTKVFDVGDELDFKVYMFPSTSFANTPYRDGDEDTFSLQFATGEKPEWLDWSVDYKLVPGAGEAEMRWDGVTVAFSGTATEPLDTEVLFKIKVVDLKPDGDGGYVKGEVWHGSHFRLQVREGENQPPAVAGGIGDQTAVVGRSFHYFLRKGIFTDPEGGNLDYEVSGLPDWLAADIVKNWHRSSHLAMAGVPARGDAGSSAEVTVTAIDDRGARTSASFTIRVASLTTVNSVQRISSGLQLELLDVELRWSQDMPECVSAVIQTVDKDFKRWVVPKSTVSQQFLCLGRAADAPYMTAANLLVAPAIPYTDESGAITCYDAEWQYQREDAKYFHFTLAKAPEVACPQTRVGNRWQLNLPSVEVQPGHCVDALIQASDWDMGSWVVPKSEVSERFACTGRTADSPYMTAANVLVGGALPHVDETGATTCYDAEWQYQRDDADYFHFRLAALAAVACP